MSDLQAENQRLQAALERVTTYAARLREALKEVASDPIAHYDYIDVGSWDCERCEIKVDIAQDALKPVSTPPPAGGQETTPSE